MATLSYCGPWLTTVAEKYAARRALLAGAARLAAVAAARLFAFRALLMGTGLALNMVALGVQLLIWALTDDELQIWCEKCAFGVKPSTQWNTETQLGEFYKATYAVGAGA